MSKASVIKVSLLAAMAVWGATAFYVADASAYEDFAQSSGTGNCSTCHPSFQGFGELHGSHSDLTGDNCTLCHVSVGAVPAKRLDEVNERGCIGCHGRAEDAGNDFVFGASAPGLGAGLRQHHTNSGVTICGACHSDADPGAYTPVGEDIVPPFYGTVAGIIPDSPCTDGLDNDGDLLVERYVGYFFGGTGGMVKRP